MYTYLYVYFSHEKAAKLYYVTYMYTYYMYMYVTVALHVHVRYRSYGITLRCYATLIKLRYGTETFLTGIALNIYIFIHVLCHWR